MMRGKENDRQNSETLDLCEKYLTKEQGVAALDLAGAEGLSDRRLHRNFAEAKEEKSLYRSCGRAGGAEDVILAVNAGASRIGHGVRAAQSEKAVKLLRDSGVTLEMCPTSNRLTGRVT